MYGPTSKHAREERSHRIANFYFNKRMSLPSSSHCSQELSPEILAKARDDWFGRIFEKCFKPATCPEINQGCALQSSAREVSSLLSEDVAKALIRRFEEPLSDSDIAVIVKLTHLDSGALRVMARMAGPDGHAAEAEV